MSWPTTSQVQRANAGEISVAPIGHIAKQTAETHPSIADPRKAEAQIGLLLAVHRVETARPAVTAQRVVMVLRVVMARPRATAPAVVTASRAPTGERDRLRLKAEVRVVMARRRVTVRRVATARRVVSDIAATASADPEAHRLGAPAKAAVTRVIVKNGLRGVSAMGETRALSRIAWTSPTFPRT
jgi:hypothetical protein